MGGIDWSFIALLCICGLLDEIRKGVRDLKPPRG